ncbi:PREDICTED: THAP domain-containing protein 5-like [Diuraphis noxia]|uniref:THAP domain-containing protein 5-like n=1 Tax=Diuraphis noxia TaxID=143948 RepID=UPI000763A4B0|nr:PREDICTED: THAP domain-containing protein 5-like [Diuraphis noxia]
MSSETFKPKDGSCCAVANCKQYSSKAKIDGTDISFHRFPKDLDQQKLWAQKCKRDDKWNPQTSYICSIHFSSDAFVHNMKAKLLGYSPRVRKLKQDAVPTLNLPAASFDQNDISISAINRRNRMDAKLAKKVHDELVTSSLSSISPPATLYIEANLLIYLFSQMLQIIKLVKT